MMTIGQIPLKSVTQIENALENAPELDVELEALNGEQSGHGWVSRRYERMTGDRTPYLDEARKLSQAVMPYLYPPDGTTDIFSLKSANQSLVAKGVLNLAKELQTTIFPANAKFFAHRILPALAKTIEVQRQELGESEQYELASVVASINNEMVARDDVIRQQIKTTPDAENFNQALVHAIIAGEVCFSKPNLSTSKIYTLEDFVAEFDSTGELVEVIVRDFIHPSKFNPEDLKDLFGSDDLEEYEMAGVSEVPVYTRQVRRYDHWEIQVEVAGKRFKKMEGEEDLEAPPFIVFPFFLFPKKKYGVGWCSHNKGDIIQYENMSLSVNELTKAACKVVAVIPPDMKVTQAELSGSAGLSYVFGSPSPLQMIFADISRNLAAVTSVYEMSKQTLMAAFLLNEAVRRDAERVTKEEIQTMMQGLRDLLGGLYLALARRVQYPYVNRVVKLMEKEQLIPSLGADSVELVLTAGIETLEAVEEMQAHDQWIQRMSLHPEGPARININEYGLRTANQLMVNVDNLMYSEEEMQAKAGVQQLVQLAQQFGPQGPQMAAMALQTMMQNPEMAQQVMAGVKSAQQPPQQEGEETGG